MNSTVTTLRARAREELLTALKDAARARLAREGAAALSLRAVARDMGLVSSAVYRYVRSRDELLTLLIIDAYDAVGAAAESADAQAAAAGLSAGHRWLAVCRAVRAWALAHPQEFALVYGSPVPGYAAPQDTVVPAQRIYLVMAEVLRAAGAAGELSAPTRLLPGPQLVTPTVVSVAGIDLPPESFLLERSVAVVIALVGALTFELFGHLHGVVNNLPAYFDVVMAVAAEGVGLTLPLGGAAAS